MCVSSLVFLGRRCLSCSYEVCLCHFQVLRLIISSREVSVSNFMEARCGVVVAFECVSESICG